MNPILPRFTVRAFFVITAVLAGVSLVVSSAIRGNEVARGVAMGLLFIALALLSYAIVYGLVYVLAVRRPETSAPTSPFAGEDPPEQVMVPVEQFPKM